MKRYFILWCLVLSASFLHANDFINLVKKYKNVAGVEYKMIDCTNVFKKIPEKDYYNTYKFLINDVEYYVSECMADAPQLKKIKEQGVIFTYLITIKNCSDRIKYQFKKELSELLRIYQYEYESDKYLLRDEEHLLKLNKNGFHNYIEYNIESTENMFLGVMLITDEYIEREGILKDFM